MFEKIIKSIESLPPLSDTAQMIHKLHRKSPDGITVDDLVSCVESDAILTANILRLVNAPYYGLKTKVTSIAHATALLGVNYVYAITLKFAMSQSLKQQAGVFGMNNDQFNNMCILQRSLLVQWYTPIDPKTVNYLAPISLMMESGKLILEKELGTSEYHGEYIKGLPRGESVEGFEKEFIGTTSYALTARLFDHWHMDPMCVEVLDALDEETDKPDIARYVQILHVIRTAVNIREQLTADSIAKASGYVEAMGLSADAFAKAAKKVKILNEIQFSNLR